MEKVVVTAYCPLMGYPKGVIVEEYSDGSRCAVWPSDLEAQRKAANRWQKNKSKGKIVRVRNKTWC